ncbi:MAG: NADH-quinone oxidoreductase subunit H [Anaerotardibacter sp.]
METLITILITLVASAVFAVVALALGCLLAGADRIVTARMQGRVGPPLLQPYYDVRKLLSKDNVSVNQTMRTYIFAALLLTFLAGGIFFSGGNFLLCVFVITMAELMFILAAYSSRSPFAEIGAHRETLQVMAYEPMVLLLAVGFYLATGSFEVSSVLYQSSPIIIPCLGIFIGFLFILTIKLRKSPFDLSYSHHAHQDLVKGITTEMSGPMLAQVEMMHWCENVLFLGWICMFFVWASPLAIVAVIVVLLVTYFLEIWIDNNFARVKWQTLLKSAWIVTLVCAGINLALLIFM